MEQNLIDALKTIQRECARHDRCDACPLRNASEDFLDGSYCYIRTHTPTGWNIIEPKIPRVFE